MVRTPANIRDVAARAGCSIATVSRVATGNGPVSVSMQKKVVDAALTLGFPLAPPSAARRPVLGVLLPSLTNPVFAGALAGIEHCARANDLSIIIGQSNYRADEEMAVIAALIAERPMGLIMTVCDPATSDVFATVTRQGIPAATVYNEGVPDGFGSVSVDNRAAMRELTEKLLNLGHRSILFVGGRFASSDRAINRYRGYCDAMKAAGCQPFAALEVDFIDATEDVDLTAALDKRHPTAIVVSNDLLALTVIASLRRWGLRVPQDVSVTGFDGIDLARHISPRLTTIVQPSRTMGVLAASMVLDIAAGRRHPAHIRADFTFARGETIEEAKPHPRTQSSSSLTNQEPHSHEN
ncbi:DNA-binding LacI/PurR family transcriptional regulator [Agrobacterium larrymoorei]|uniref:DNA-binding LacI/PurR family transcriptional regulator n=1 Tax=Agrobacterium larrymoorei TaxID=160699 RepID=A0AAJ2B9P4_9HYPH|nr:substrate-binding domain-containing protein [Agrobacterium larrymoorei]MDR6099993.1 DNA-binding LacI/PurR family transcriptional regulator [Agrobacterium larrymoorei]